MKGLFIIILVIVAALIAIPAIIEVTPSPTGSMTVNLEQYDFQNINTNLSSNQQLQERYLRQTYLLSQTLAKGNEISTINTGLNRMDNFSTAIYAGSVAANALKINSIVTVGSSAVSTVYELRMVEQEINNILPLYARVTQASRDYKKNSTIEETEDYLALVGEFGGKTLYFSLRTDAKAMSAFMSGIFKLVQKSGLKEEVIKQKCGERCYNLYLGAKENSFEIATRILPVIDYGLYELFGLLGRFSAPIIFKGTSFTENEVQNTIIPGAGDLQVKILSQINSEA